MAKHQSFARDPASGAVVRCRDADHYAELRLSGWLPSSADEHAQYIAERLRRIQAKNRERSKAAAL